MWVNLQGASSSGTEVVALGKRVKETIVEEVNHFLSVGEI